LLRGQLPESRTIDTSWGSELLSYEKHQEEICETLSFLGNLSNMWKEDCEPGCSVMLWTGGTFANCPLIIEGEVGVAVVYLLGLVTCYHICTDWPLRTFIWRPDLLLAVKVFFFIGWQNTWYGLFCKLLFREGLDIIF
jgi:hypothetical protein